MSNPLFSIITPSYNREHLISVAIDSVLAQSYSNFELIIVDDGSTDNTADVVLKYTDARIKYFKKRNEERGAARNYGIRQSSGDYICFLDSDDIYYPNHLRSAADFIEDNEGAIFFYQPFEVEEKGVRKKQAGFSGLSVRQIADNNVLCPIGAFIKREVLMKHPFNTDPKFTIAEDLYLWLIIGIRHGIELNDKYTSCLINHDSRSMANLDPNRLIYCTHKLINLLKEDYEFSKHPDLINKVLASHYSLVSLYFSLIDKKIKAMNYLVMAFKINPYVMFRKRTIVIFKNLLLP